MSALAWANVKPGPVVWLVPVRSSSGTHLARRDGKLGVEEGPALCGALGDLDRYARPRWRRVRSAVSCMACHARACAMPSRVDRS